MANNALEFIAKYKFIYLLAALLLFLLIHPLFEHLVFARILLQILDSAVLVTAIYAVSQNRKLLIFGILLLLPAMIGSWSLYVIEIPALELMARSFSALFFAFAATVMMLNVFSEEEVTVDTISGAICVYLMMGLTWAFIYSVIEFLAPGSFTINKVPLSLGGDRYYEIPLFLYYSFVTLTTLGYGDITPLTPPARAFSYVEAIIGQIFVAVLIARLVGLHIARSTSKDSDRSIG
ncbi:MAG: potassium channel family protein [Gammaproteobacteria bacterium]